MHPSCRAWRRIGRPRRQRQKELPVSDSKTVQLTAPATNEVTSLPVVTGTLGDPAFDIGKLNKETGYFTFDPGFMSTAATRSAVTFIDGDAGVLLYRGYPIDQLAKQSSFLEVAYLLINGELPNAAQNAAFEHEITHHTMMHEALKNFLHGFHYDAHPMAMLCASIASLSAFYHDTLDLNDPEQRRLAAIVGIFAIRRWLATVRWCGSVISVES
jgi:citrate synthase